MFPTKYKAAVVKPLLKKSGFDSASPANYRPSSNVKFWIICLKHAYNHISSPPLISVSSSRSIGPFTQRKLPCCTRLTISTDHLTKADRPSWFLLTSVLLLVYEMPKLAYNLLRLYDSFGISGTAFSWICSYLKRRSQCVRAGQSLSRYRECFSGVPQGSVLGPLLFSVYTSPISFIASDLGISLQQYAVNTQLYISVSADDLTVHLNSLESCLHSLHLWLCHNGLALNSGKSESILFSTPSRICNFPSVSGVNIAGTLVPISDKIVTLGVTLDPHLALSHRTSDVAGLLIFIYALFATSDLYLRKTWLSQWLSQWFTHA